MQDFDTSATGSDHSEHDDGNHENGTEGRFRELLSMLSKRLILLISFGPGVFGLLWLLGRILRR